MRKEAPVTTQLNAIEVEAGCHPGEHNYCCIAFHEGAMLVTEDGTRIVLFVCSKCGQERVVNMTALGIPRCTAPSAR
jgi:hypothetical protein